MAAEAPANQERRPSSRPSSREPKGGADYDGSVANTVSSVPVLPGRLGAYDVQKAVGKGGYAVVYKGVRHEDGRVVAIKKVEVRATFLQAYCCLNFVEV